MQWWFVVVVAAVVISCGVTAQQDATVALSQGATLVGSVDAEYVSFKGIRYAKAPIGNLRFADPVAFTYAPNSTTSVTQFGAACIQTTYHGMLWYYGGYSEQQSEDCLFLNVYVPRVDRLSKQSTSDSKRPVLVWIHGGGFAIGSGAAELYEPTMVVKRGMIMVTVNYRLGPLGFMSHAALSRERMRTGGGVYASGNYGMHDQLLALQWIRDNIESFGGDRHRITLGGHSAGAASVAYLMLSPLTAQYSQDGALFHRAVVMGSSMNFKLPTLEESERDASMYSLSALGCDRGDPHDDNYALTCLRSLSSDHFRERYWPSVAPFSPARMDNARGQEVRHMRVVIDGHLLTEQPAVLIRQRKFTHSVPTLVGTTEDENTLFTFFQYPLALSHKHMAEIMNDTFGDDRVLDVADTYPAHGLGTKAFVSRVGADMQFSCPARAFARGVATTLSAASPHAYLYRFRLDRSSGLLARVAPPSFGSFHGSCQFYMFLYTAGGFVQYTPAEVALHSRMLDALERLATGGAIDVRDYKRTAKQDGFEFSITTGTDDDERCDRWDKILLQCCDSASPLLNTSREGWLSSAVNTGSTAAVMFVLDHKGWAMTTFLILFSAVLCVACCNMCAMIARKARRPASRIQQPGRARPKRD